MYYLYGKGNEEKGVKTNYVYPFPIPKYETIDSELILNIEENIKSILNKTSLDKYDISNEIKKNNELIYKIYNIDLNSATLL